MTDEERDREERKREEVLIEAQFIRRKTKGALTEIREALHSLDKLLARMQQ